MERRWAIVSLDLPVRYSNSLRVVPELRRRNQPISLSSLGSTVVQEGPLSEDSSKAIGVASPKS